MQKMIKVGFMISVDVNKHSEVCLTTKMEICSLALIEALYKSLEAYKKLYITSLWTYKRGSSTYSIIQAIDMQPSHTL